MMSIDRIFFFIGSLLGFSGVAAGAFGGHLLKTRLTPDMLAIYEIATRYQLIHALALLACAWAAVQYSHPWVRTSGWLFLAGTILFSGSLYLLALTRIKALGAVTPIGGLLLLAAWLSLAFGIFNGR